MYKGQDSKEKGLSSSGTANAILGKSLQTSKKTNYSKTRLKVGILESDQQNRILGLKTETENADSNRKTRNIATKKQYLRKVKILRNPINDVEHGGHPGYRAEMKKLEREIFEFQIIKMQPASPEDAKLIDETVKEEISSAIPPSQDEEEHV